MPHFEICWFLSRFPTACITLADARFPGVVEMTAFNPFIPLNDRDSSVPAAMFAVTVFNTTDAAIDCTVVGVLGHGPHSPTRAERVAQDNLAGVRVVTDATAAGDADYTELMLVTNAAETSHQTYLYDGMWFDSLQVYWDDTSRSGRFRDHLTVPAFGARGMRRSTAHSLQAAHTTVQPGQRRTIRFVLAWHVPNFVKSWETPVWHFDQPGSNDRSWRNWHATEWDGVAAVMLKLYRDWKLCGDDAWLKRIWPLAKKSVEYAWSPENDDLWDPQRSGVLWGRQHHTLDMEVFGPNVWLTGFYLGALKAGAEIAAYLGNDDTAADWRAMFERGRSWLDANLFSGEHYVQKLDLAVRRALDPYANASVSRRLVGGNIYDLHWSAEHSEIKYQIGDGCIIDQMLGPWHANLYGLATSSRPRMSSRPCARSIGTTSRRGWAMSPTGHFALTLRRGVTTLAVPTLPVGDAVVHVTLNERRLAARAQAGRISFDRTKLAAGDVLRVDCAALSVAGLRDISSF